MICGSSFGGTGDLAGLVGGLRALNLDEPGRSPLSFFDLVAVSIAFL